MIMLKASHKSMLLAAEWILCCGLEEVRVSHQPRQEHRGFGSFAEEVIHKRRCRACLLPLLALCA